MTTKEGGSLADVKQSLQNALENPEEILGVSIEYLPLSNTLFQMENKCMLDSFTKTIEEHVNLVDALIPSVQDR